MKRFQVVVSPVAKQQITDQGRFIAEQSGSLKVALRWVEQIYEVIDSLDFSPRRYELAEENSSRAYEIRRLLIGKYLVLYTIDDNASTVSVIGLRHGSRLPRPGELPEGL